MNKESIIRRNNITIFGKGSQPMLFAHGYGCDQTMWRFVAPTFEEDYQVILFDFVGSGGSDKDAYNRDRYASLHGYAQDVLDIINALELKNLIYVGHSNSSMIGMLASLEQPESFARLVMVSPNPCFINEGDYTGGFQRGDIDGLIDTMEKNYVGFTEFMAPVMMKNPERPELSAEVKESLQSINPDIARQFAEATFYCDFRRELLEVQVPTLVMQSGDDIIAPVVVGEYTARHIPDSTLKMMKASGHCAHVSAPEETIGIIKEYIRA